MKGWGKYPDVIQRSWQRPDIIVHSVSVRQFIMIGLTAMYEPRMKRQPMYNVAKYEGLVADLRDDGYTVRF